MKFAQNCCLSFIEYSHPLRSARLPHFQKLIFCRTSHATVYEYRGTSSSTPDRLQAPLTPSKLLPVITPTVSMQSTHTLELPDVPRGIDQLASSLRRRHGRWHLPDALTTTPAHIQPDHAPDVSDSATFLPTCPPGLDAHAHPLHGAQ